jgi:hypothetical protein
MAKVSRVLARAEDSPEKKNPTIYFVSDAKGEFLKVGFTNSVEKLHPFFADRVSGITASPPGNSWVARHGARASSPVRCPSGSGEWFKRCESILQFIALHRA